MKLTHWFVWSIIGATICAERTAIVKAVVSWTQNIFPRYSSKQSFACRVKGYALLWVWLWLRESSVFSFLLPPTDPFCTNFILLIRDTDVTISPCGMCRQVLREFCPLNMPVFLVPGDYPKPQLPDRESKPGYTEGGVRETTLEELLPDSFGPEHLELPRKSWAFIQIFSGIFSDSITSRLSPTSIPIPFKSLSLLLSRIWPTVFSNHVGALIVLFSEWSYAGLMIYQFSDSSLLKSHLSGSYITFVPDNKSMAFCLFIHVDESWHCWTLGLISYCLILSSFLGNLNPVSEY